MGLHVTPGSTPGSSPSGPSASFRGDWAADTTYNVGEFLWHGTGASRALYVVRTTFLSGVSFDATNLDVVGLPPGGSATQVASRDGSGNVAWRDELVATDETVLPYDEVATSYPPRGTAPGSRIWVGPTTQEPPEFVDGDIWLREDDPYVPVHSHVKANITDFAHTHVKADVTDFAHTHTSADVTDFAAAVVANAPAATYAGDRYQKFTASGTWTKPSGVTKVRARVMGGGGGGGGGGSAAAATAQVGGGGGGCGGVWEGWLDVTTDLTVTIGAGGTTGTGGAAGGNAGTNGGAGTTGVGGNGGTGAAGLVEIWY
jgi:hypothetical protein